MVTCNGTSESSEIRLGVSSHWARPLGLSSDDMTGHMLVLGPSVSGRQKFLQGIMEQTVAGGLGGFFVNCNADIAKYDRLRQMCRDHGREDDLVLLNFLPNVPFRQEIASDEYKENKQYTYNPFHYQNGEDLANLVFAHLIGANTASTEGDMLSRNRAISMLAAIIEPLVWMRGNKEMKLTPSVIREHISLPALIDLSENAEIPPHKRERLQYYLKSLPGYIPERGTRQSPVTSNHHSHLELQFAQALDSLSKTYDTIFARSVGRTLDLSEVLKQRRIVMVMLPSFNRSFVREVAAFGGVVVQSLQSTLADVLSQEPLSDPSKLSFICILDSYSYYATRFNSPFLFQAQRQGVGVVIADESISCFKELQEAALPEIIANTGTKVFLRSDDPETAALLPTSFDSPSVIEAVRLRQLSRDQAYVMKLGHLHRVNLQDQGEAPEKG